MTPIEEIRAALIFLSVKTSWAHPDAALAALSELEDDLAELVMLPTHALTALRAHGYEGAADHLQEVLNRFEVKK